MSLRFRLAGSRLVLENPRRDAVAILSYSAASDCDAEETQSGGALPGAPPPRPPPWQGLPLPPPVVPSRAAVKAAAIALADRIASARSGAELTAAVRDEDGTLAAAAAIALGWEATELPSASLAGVRLVPH